MRPRAVRSTHTAEVPGPVSYRFFYDDVLDELRIDVRGGPPPQLRLRSDVITRRDASGAVTGYVIPAASVVLGSAVAPGGRGPEVYGHGGSVARSILAGRAGPGPERGLMRRSRGPREVPQPEAR